MIKVGMFTGKRYGDKEIIKECCFNVSDEKDITEDILNKNKMNCIKCAVCCNFESDCMPCEQLREDPQWRSSK